MAGKLLASTGPPSAAEPAENTCRADPRLVDGSAKRLFTGVKLPRADVFGKKNGWTGFKKYDITWPMSRNPSGFSAPKGRGSSGEFCPVCEPPG